MSGIAGVRSALYKLLASGYSPPTPTLWEVVASGEFARRSEALSAELAAGGLPIADRGAATGVLGAEGLGPDELGAAYVAAFDVGLPRPPCPLYEGCYREGAARASILREVAVFYRAFGLVLADEFKEIHDHVVAELEFMHFLAFKEAQAERDGLDAEPYRRAQRDFLDRHLARWMPGLQGAVEGAALPGFYLALTRLTHAFVVADRDYVRSALLARLDRPAPSVDS